MAFRDSNLFVIHYPARAKRISTAGANTVRNSLRSSGLRCSGLRRFSCQAIFAGVFSLALLGCYEEGDEETGYTPKVYAYANNQEALAELRSGRAEAALAAVNRAIDDDPGYAQAYRTKAAILARLGLHEEGTAVLKSLTGLQPDLAEAHMALGIFLESGGAGKESRAAYAQAVKLYEAQAGSGALLPEAGVNFAIASFMLKGKISGIRAIDKVVAAYPEYRPALLVKNQILLGSRGFFLRWAAAPAGAAEEPEGTEEAEGRVVPLHDLGRAGARPSRDIN